MNFLFCSVGRRAELIKDFKLSMSLDSKIIATDNSNLAPALYFADKYYLVPSIEEPIYIQTLLDICEKEKVNVIATFIDPEISLLARNRGKFEQNGIIVLAPELKDAELCFDKYLMFLHLKKYDIPTVESYANIAKFNDAFKYSKIAFPVFVKPRTGSGSVGARKIYSMEELNFAVQEDESLIIQEYMVGDDLDADVYIDTITHQAVSAFLKRKLSTTLGGANKTVSFRSEKLFKLIEKICSIFKFYGPVDMDFFCKDEEYYLSEINPRFGGAYLHAYGAGVDFVKMIEKNVNGEKNIPHFGAYRDDIVMMMYDSVVIKSRQEMERQE